MITFIKSHKHFDPVYLQLQLQLQNNPWRVTHQMARDTKEIYKHFEGEQGHVCSHIWWDQGQK